MTGSLPTILGTAILTLAIPLSATQAAEPVATARLIDLEGRSAGTVEFTDTPSGLMLVKVSAEGVSAGRHGFHIHETGQCDPATGFKSAGGHLAGDKSHGVLSEDGPHPGDLPNVTVGEDGRMDAEFFVSRLSVEGGWFEARGLFDEDGSAVMVHSGPDDYTSQPSGAAGDRVLCGVIEQ